MRKTRERQWSDPVKDKPVSEKTLNTKGDLGTLRDVLRRVVVKKEEEPSPPLANIKRI